MEEDEKRKKRKRQKLCKMQLHLGTKPSVVVCFC
jgi:hypothetical protein